MMNRNIFKRLSKQNPNRINIFKKSLFIEHTFFEYMFCSEKPNVESRALIRPNKLNEISVTVAIVTPIMMGINEK